jgi:hypothetical protein
MPRRRAETVSDQQLQKVLAAKTIARLMTMMRDHLTKAEIATVAPRRLLAANMVTVREQLTLITIFEELRARGLVAIPSSTESAPDPPISWRRTK